MNVERGFWRGGTFHPIRASRDYEPSRAGEQVLSKRWAAARGRRHTGATRKKVAMPQF